METNLLLLFFYGLISIFLIGSFVDRHFSISIVVSVILTIVLGVDYVQNNYLMSYSVILALNLYAIYVSIKQLLKVFKACYISTIKISVFLIGLTFAILSQYFDSILLFSCSVSVLVLNLILFKILTVKILKNDSLNKRIDIKCDEEDSLIETLHKIENWFESSECYLNSNYTLTQLESDLAINKREISLALNKVKGANFYQFIAYYRIVHAKEMLTKNENYTLESLSNDCGFYSKTTFNKYFKKYEGITPSMFKVSHN